MLSERLNNYMSKQKFLYLDILRILAVTLVIFNHSPGYNKTFELNNSYIRNIILTTIGIITKINVPLFLMISGALLISKEESWNTIIRKRVLRILIVLPLVHIIIYAENLIMCMNSGSSASFSISDFFTQMLSNKMDGTIAYWYLYAYIVYLITLPFLRKICVHMNHSDWLAFYILKITFFTILPILNLYGADLTIASSSRLVLISTDIIFYPMVGYHISNLEHENLKKFCKKALLLFLVLFAAYFYYISIISKSENDIEVFKSYIVWSLTIFVFSATRIHTKNIIVHDNSATIIKYISLLASATFGVYLIEPMVGRNLFSMFEDCSERYLSSLSISIIWCMLVLFIAGNITILLKKYTILRKIL